jgi:4-amino-4-deoxy-L-arabinose transferase-like glycosyltransferase
VLIPVIFFSFSGSKLPGYILPIFPAIALLVGLELKEWWEKEEPGRMRLLAIGTASLIVVAALIFRFWVGREMGLNSFNGFKLASLAIVVGVVYLALWFFWGGRTGTIFLPFGLALILVAAVNLVFPDLGRSESLRDLSLIAKGAARPGERLVFYINQNHGINFYATDLPLRDERSDLVTIVSLQDLEPLIKAYGGAGILVISQQRWLGYLKYIPELNVEWLGEQKNNLGCAPDCTWVLFRAELKRPAE